MENDKRVDNIRRLYSLNKRYFGKNILDIACGGGILGFLVEADKKEYTGMDINEDMINLAKNYSKKVNSNNKFILGNVINTKIKYKFDTFSFIGNGLAHINTLDFVKILDNLKNCVKKGSYFVIDYRDAVQLLFKRQWRDKMIVKKKGKIFLSLTKGINVKNGEINKMDYEKGTNNKVYFSHAIWSPFILEAIMNSKGWILVKRSVSKEWTGCTDIYKKE